MRIESPLFYQSNLSADQSVLSLEEDTRKHVVTVLRMKEGDMLMLTNGKGLSAHATIQRMEKKQTYVTVDSFQEYERKGMHISLGISLLKNNTRFEWMLEKVTELGVYEIFPLVLDRTERQHFRKERFEQIIRSACLQSEQFLFPALHDPHGIHELFNRKDLPDVRMIAHCYENEKFPAVKITDHSLLLIGPEGDFTSDELQFALTNGCKPVSLGETRLRTETAAIAGVVLLRG
jgi:16S rRNA (uracil1498-N3)-methyltransferase